LKTEKICKFKFSKSSKSNFKLFGLIKLQLILNYEEKRYFDCYLSDWRHRSSVEYLK
jgi:hypothetical protein